MISVHLTPNSICKLPVGKQSVDRLTTLNCWRLRLLLPTTTLDEDVEDDEDAILVSLVCATCCHSLASSDLDSFRTVDCSVLLWYSDCIWLEALSACS